jgi:general secretion pathway protein A
MAVYEAYYGCRREPFSLSPDPSFLYAAPPHREALAQLRYLVQERKGFAVVTGEVGTGKTMLLRSLMESVGPKVHTGYVFNPPRTSQALYEAIADELGISLSGTANPTTQLNRYLLSAYEKGETVAMIFDEAQSLPSELLEEIRLLTNLETSSAKLLQVILAGQTEFDAMIDSVELRALRQRLVFRYSLTPLGPSDTVRYIAARLVAAGADASPFTLKACRTVHHYSSGIPRLINVVCDNAMLAGYASDCPVIDEKQVEEVAGDLRLLNAPSVRRKSARQPKSAELPLARTDTASQRPPTSRRRLIYAFVIASIVLALAIAAITVVAQQPADVPSPLTQLQQLFENAGRWLRGVDQSSMRLFARPIE